MTMITRHKIRDPFFRISENDIFVVDINTFYVEYLINIWVMPRKMLQNNILKVFTNISSTGKFDDEEYFSLFSSNFRRDITFDVTKAIPNNLRFTDKSTVISYNDDSIKLISTNSGELSSKLSLELDKNNDPSFSAIIKKPISAFDKNSGNLSINTSNDFIYPVYQSSNAQSKKIKRKKYKKIAIKFKVPHWKRSEFLFFKFTEVGRNKMPKSYSRIKINCQRKINEFLVPQTKPTISGKQVYSGHILNIFHPDKRIKKLRLFSKKMSGGKKNNFKLLKVIEVENSNNTTIKVPETSPAIYRVQGHGEQIVHADTRFSSCIVGDIKAADRKLDPYLIATQENDYINIRFFMQNIDIVSAELRRIDMKSKNDELVSANVAGFESFNDKTAKHRQQYSYYLKYFTKGGLHYKTAKTNIVDFAKPSLKFSLSSVSSFTESGQVTIELTPVSEDSDASIFYSSFFNDSPSLSESDLNSLIDNYDFIVLTKTERINLNTGKIKSLGFSGNINEDGKIILSDKIRNSGDYLYVSTLYARPIKQIMADINATAKFRFQNKGKFSDMISDSLLSTSVDLNFDEKFLNQYSIFDSTLVYGRSMAEKFEKIIEHGKTGIVSSATINFSKDDISPIIFNEKIIEKQKRPQLSFKIKNASQLDSLLVKVQTAENIYFIDCLYPSTRIKFTDNITRKGTGKVAYSIVPIDKEFSALAEVFIGSFFFDDENKRPKIRKNIMQGL